LLGIHNADLLTQLRNSRTIFQPYIHTTMNRLTRLTISNAATAFARLFIYETRFSLTRLLFYMLRRYYNNTVFVRNYYPRTHFSMSSAGIVSLTHNNNCVANMNTSRFHRCGSETFMTNPFFICIAIVAIATVFFFMHLMSAHTFHRIISRYDMHLRLFKPFGVAFLTRLDVKQMLDVLYSLSTSFFSTPEI